VETPKKRTLAAVATAPNPVVAVPLGRTPEIGFVQLKIAMLAHAAAPSAAHWQSFAASIARVETQGCVAPTVWVDRDLRGATVRIAGRDTATAIRLVRLHASNSPSPQLWQPHFYQVTVLDSEDLP
jgi:hypothetical protein